MLNRIVLIVFVLLVIISAVYALRDTKDYTTSSDEAYNLLLEGKDLRSKLYVTEANRDFEEAIKLDSNFSIAWVELSQGMMTTGDSKLAQDYLDRAMKNYSNLKEHEKLYLDIHEAYYKNNIDEGLRLANQYTEKFPKRLEGHLILGNNAWERGDIETAINEYNKIIKLDSAYAPAYNSLGYLEFGNGNFNKALEYFDVYIKLLPDQANPHDSRGEILMAVGRYDEALQEFKTAHQIEPKFSFVLYHMKDIYTYKGIFGKVDKIFDQIAALCQTEKERRAMNLYRLRSYVQRGDSANAMKLANAFINNDFEDGGDYARYWGNLNAAQAYLYTDVNKASQYLDEARKIHDLEFASKIDSGAVLETQGWLLMVEGLIDLEKKDYKDVLVLEDVIKDKRYWRPDVLIDMKNILAKAYYHLDRKVDCFRLMNENLALNPNHPATNYYMADIYELEGNIPLAIKHLSKTLDVFRDADDKFIRLAKFQDKMAELNSLANK